MISKKIKHLIPLQARIHLGPIVAYFFYVFYTNFSKKPLNPNVLSIEDTLDHIVKHNLSAVRFGDGEISLMNNSNLLFQDKNTELAKKLETIVTTNDPKLLICILNVWDNKIKSLAKHVYWFELHHILTYHAVWKKILSPTQVYGDAFITRPYITIQDKTRSDTIFKKLKSLWSEKDVVLIEGVKARNGVGNDLFNNVKTLERILCPAENAYSKFDEIMKQALLIPKEKLILVSLGPTAKPIAYDLFKAGYRVLDIGHIDMEYEMFLKKSNHFSKVKYKYFSEINERNPEECDDESYLRQIVAKVI
jgi:glycosyltransferase family protein